VRILSPFSSALTDPRLIWLSSTGPQSAHGQYLRHFQPVQSTILL
jgi:hypothetical protein